MKTTGKSTTSVRSHLLLLLLLFFTLVGCSQGNNLPTGAYPRESTADAYFSEFDYLHFSSGGASEKYKAVILFEQSNSTFTAYQVAFLSCTCRDAIVNYYSVCYVELLNSKPTAEEASIRAISFAGNMGLWGDSNPNYYIAEYTAEYLDENFVQQLVRLAKRDFDSWQGYGSQLEVIDIDAVSGASVSTANITSMLQSLFVYHTAKYYVQ